MPKTTKKIISDAIDEGIVNKLMRNGDSVYYEIISHPNYVTDSLWFSQSELEELQKELNDYYCDNPQMCKYINDRFAGHGLVRGVRR